MDWAACYDLLSSVRLQNEMDGTERCKIEKRVAAGFSDSRGCCISFRALSRMVANGPGNDRLCKALSNFAFSERARLQTTPSQKHRNSNQQQFCSIPRLLRSDLSFWYALRINRK